MVTSFAPASTTGSIGRSPSSNLSKQPLAKSLAQSDIAGPLAVVGRRLDFRLLSRVNVCFGSVADVDVGSFVNQSQVQRRNVALRDTRAAFVRLLRKA